jgi:hypothetical protein
LFFVFFVMSTHLHTGLDGRESGADRTDRMARIPAGVWPG